jgi:hypothetical protein
MKNTSQLYLVLNKQWFTEILEGRKTEEYRNFSDFYINRLCELNEEGEILDTKKYDTLKFQMGYAKNAPQMVIEVLDIRIDVDEEVDFENGDLLTQENCNFTIVLGKILEKINID